MYYSRLYGYLNIYKKICEGSDVAIPFFVVWPLCSFGRVCLSSLCIQSLLYAPSSRSALDSAQWYLSHESSRVLLLWYLIGPVVRLVVAAWVSLPPVVASHVSALFLRGATHVSIQPCSSRGARLTAYAAFRCFAEGRSRRPIHVVTIRIRWCRVMCSIALFSFCTPFSPSRSHQEPHQPRRSTHRSTQRQPEDGNRTSNSARRPN